MLIPPQLEHLQMILASRSPRRAELLTKANCRFIVQPANDSVEPGLCSNCSPEQFVADLALMKAQDVSRRATSALVIGADTVAEIDGRIVGKPVDEEHARQILTLLSGRLHRVLTGISICRTDLPACVTRVEQTRLKMAPLSPQQIDDYLETGLWIGKAGAFGYQDGPDWLHVIEGLESNVVGLPVERIPEMLHELAGRK